MTSSFSFAKQTDIGGEEYARDAQKGYRRDAQRRSFRRRGTGAMLTELQQLAQDIACLSASYAQAEGTPDGLMIAQVITHLQSALDDLSQRHGVFVGPMLWWAQWQGREAG